MKIGWGVLELSLTWPVAYTTACTTVQAMIPTLCNCVCQWTKLHAPACLCMLLEAEVSWVSSFIDGAEITETVTTGPDDELSKLPQQSVLEQMGLQSASEHRHHQLRWVEWRQKSIPRCRSIDGEAPLADSCLSTRDKPCPRCCRTQVPTISRSDWPTLDPWDSMGLHRVGTSTQHCCFKCYSLANRQPMKIRNDWSDVVATTGPRDQSCSGIFYWLKSS